MNASQRIFRSSRLRDELRAEVLRHPVIFAVAAAHVLALAVILAVH